MSIQWTRVLYFVVITRQSNAPTLKRNSNWPTSFCYILGKVFREKYK